MKKKIISILLLMQATCLVASPLCHEVTENAFHSMLASTNATPVEHAETRWAIYLSNQISSRDLFQFDPIVLAPKENAHPPLAPLIVKNKRILAKLSLTSIDKKDPYYNDIKNANILIGNNPTSPDLQFVDIRSPIWTDMILNKVMPELFAEGFTGFLLSNLDACINLEHQDPEKYQGMAEAAIQILTRVRTVYPGTIIMLDLTGMLHKAAAFSDCYDLAYFENLFTEPSLKGRKISSAERFSLIVGRLHEIKQKHPIYTFDMWSPKDPMAKHIAQLIRKEGFSPYVTERLDVLNDAF